MPTRGIETRHRQLTSTSLLYPTQNNSLRACALPRSWSQRVVTVCVYVDPRNTPGWYGRPHLDLLSTLNRAPTHARHTSRRQDTKLLFTAHSLPRFTATGCHVASMRLPLCLRRLCRGSLRYWEPCAFFEALVSIFSGMLLWMGFWDLIEMLLPPDAFTRLAMIAVGIIGLFGTRTMYDKSVLQSVRSRSEREERADAAMLSSMEMANYAGEGEGSNAADAGGKGGGSGSSSSSSGNGDGMSSRSVTIVGSEGFTDITPSKEACSKDRNARGSSSGGAAVSAASAGASAAEAQMTCVAPTPTALSMDATAPPCQRTHRPFFDAPRPDAKLLQPRRVCHLGRPYLMGGALGLGGLSPPAPSLSWTEQRLEHLRICGCRPRTLAARSSPSVRVHTTRHICRGRRWSLGDSQPVWDRAGPHRPIFAVSIVTRPRRDKLIGYVAFLKRCVAHSVCTVV